jgi:peroxiredoxin
VADDVTYAYYPVFSRFGMIPRERLDVDHAVHELESLFDEFSDRISIRGFYSSVGFRPRCDLIMWWVTNDPDDIQELVVRLRQTTFGARLHQQYAFTGVHRPPEFNPQHMPAFLRGEPPRKYICVYPFVRTEEWYLLPAEERAALLKEHGEMGREFPDVLPNTTSAFGLGDWEWILAFEADELHRIVDCIRRLRDSETRRYVKKETPFVVGIRKDLRAVIGDLG